MFFGAGAWGDRGLPCDIPRAARRGQRDPIPLGSIANLLRSGITSSGRALISYDSRNDRMFPTRGWYNTVSAEVADKFLGSENLFTRYEAVTRFFYPIWGPFVFRLKLEGGLSHVAQIEAIVRAGIPFMGKLPSLPQPDAAPGSPPAAAECAADRFVC